MSAEENKKIKYPIATGFAAWSNVYTSKTGRKSPICSRSGAFCEWNTCI